jgi:hypothetical protein
MKQSRPSEPNICATTFGSVVLIPCHKCPHIESSTHLDETIIYFNTSNQKLNPTAQRCLTRFNTCDFAS